MKICLTCKCEKDFTEFGKDKQKKDGLNPYCKACIRIRSDKQRKNDPKYVLEYAREYRKKNRELLIKKSRKLFHENRELFLEKNRDYYHRNKDVIAVRRKKEREDPKKKEKDRIRMNEWRNKHPNRARNAVKKWQQKHRDRHCAHQRVHRAVENGILIRPVNCEKCGMKGKIEGHHEDYSKPLDVIWLCIKCHRLLNQTVEVSY